MPARSGIESKTAIHAYASASQMPPAMADDRTHAMSTCHTPLDRSGTARQTYQADRQTKEYARKSGRTSTSASANVNPCRLSTPAINVPTTTQAPRYSASRSGRVRIGCMNRLALDVHAAHHDEAAQHEASAGVLAVGIRIGLKRWETLVFDATHEGHDGRAHFPARRHDNLDTPHEGNDIENRFFARRDRRQPQIQLTAAHDGRDVAAPEWRGGAHPPNAAPHCKHRDLLRAIRVLRGHGCRSARCGRCVRHELLGHAKRHVRVRGAWRL